MLGVARHLPARLMTPDERALFDDWLATAGDIASAYISQRRGDDPILRNRIVLAAGPDESPSHIVFAAIGRDIWVVLQPSRRTRIQRFRTLHAVLDSLRSTRPAAASVGARDHAAQDVGS
jgi:hypothetical protein